MSVSYVHGLAKEIVDIAQGISLRLILESL